MAGVKDWRRNQLRVGVGTDLTDLTDPTDSGRLCFLLCRCSYSSIFPRPFGPGFFKKGLQA